ncbi:DUF6311 domain-containing protein [Methylomagnum ishizawai]|uniref:DUF6311 domain-containing protein n=1 Tax=Methylomagnum ishizawai TaxID=1760988 RepID=UPI001C7E6D46|nr:DUF6311 domain-containing protein [Methylomagnum ishizawai]
MIFFKKHLGIETARFWREFIIAGRFGMVGATATAVHITVVWLLVGTGWFPVLAANLVAFLTAFGISFTGNYCWTFSRPGCPRRALARFFLISGSAFTANTVVLAALLRTGWLAPQVAAVASAALIPVITFLASRLWVFRASMAGSGANPVGTGLAMFSGGNRAGWIAALPVVLGMAAFWMVVGPRVLDPTNIAWLGDGDPATHYLGWQFFRHSDWHFPLGLNPDYGLELGNAIVFSDSNPLMAFLFKPVAALLPEPFQYFGLWMLACFILQAWFAWKLLGLVVDSQAIRALGCGLFLFSPPMIWRLNGHISLMGHFLILAALYLVLCPWSKRRSPAWALLLGVTALVHSYFLAMVAALWLADLVGQARLGKRGFRGVLAELILDLAMIGTICWQAGYFSINGGMIAGGYGYYRMNFLSLFDADGWSYVLRDIPGGGGDYEGFNFLGLGVVFLLIWSIPPMIRMRPVWMGAVRKRPALVCLFIALSVFALSNNIGIGPYNIEFALPEWGTRLANTFRSSGRMFWPVFYVLLLTIIYVIARAHEKRVAVGLLAVALAVQVVDTGAAWRDFHARYMATPAAEWKTPLRDPFWAEAATHYKKVRWVRPENHTPDWQVFAAYAGRYGLGTDAVYLARVGAEPLAAAQAQAGEAIATGRYEPDSLYIVEEAVLGPALLGLDAKTDLLARIDGFNVLAPGWKTCAACGPVAGGLSLTDIFPPIRVGERIQFTRSAPGTAYLVAGWSGPEPWGTWSERSAAKLRLPLSSADAQEILIEANALVASPHPEQAVEVWMNGVLAGTERLAQYSGNQIRMAIPQSVRDQFGTDPVLNLKFKFPGVVRPVDIGLGDDKRHLALGLIAITVR